MQARVKIYALHGFLGSPVDWKGFDVEPVDLFSDGMGSMADWARRFCASVRSEGTAQVLLGYSMGGRLAMHALLEDSSLFRAAVLVSASPGVSAEERAARMAADEAWARRFESEEWGSVMRDWNAQSVFAGMPSPVRAESPGLRAQAAACLREWSVARQEDLRSRLRSLSLPVLWVAGERDSKYAGVLREVESWGVPSFSTRLVAGAGHRVPWESTTEFQGFLSGLRD